MPMRHRPPFLLAPWAAALLLAACGGSDNDDGPRVNALPDGMTAVSRTAYTATAPGDGASAATQDLLTGGLGASGLAATGAVPAYADPAQPTALELRRNALQSNYRGLVDATSGGGFGRLYGPNLDAAGADTRGEGLVPGLEVVGVLDNDAGTKRVTMAVLIPDSFDPDEACLVLGPSSGSRGVYGAIGTAGEWALKRGCAVALTDTGKGMGLYDPADDSVHRLDGTRATRAAAGSLAHFAATLSDAARAAFNTAFPNRLSLKQAHSQLNPEADWGSDTLAAARFALWALNEEYGEAREDGRRTVRLKADNTLVIAGSVSNGGAAVLRAAELDDDDLIDGVVAGEPSAQPRSTEGYGVQQGGVAVPVYGRPLLDYFTYANLYQPCAALAADATMVEASIHNYMTLTGMNTRAANRCAALADRGLLEGTTLADQAADALNKLRAYGWVAENDTMHNAHYGLGNAVIISTMYTMAYGQASLLDNLCGASFAATNALTGAPVAVSALAKASSFASGNGTSNGSPAAVVINEAVGGATRWDFAVSPGSGTADFGLDVALCQRALATGVDTASGQPLTAGSTPTLAQSQAVQAGVDAVRLKGDLQGKPTLVVAGRSDALLPVNHAARAYTAFNRATEGSDSRLRYVEVTNAQHFDGFNGFTGFDTRYVPLHVYFNAAMDAMFEHLKNDAALPASQVVRTTPRGGVPGAAPPVTRAQLPAWVAQPPQGDAIVFSGEAVNVPD